ncbi:unnamed protein product [Orchesella dallaii]|uniref:CCHC-type domain-containing protein n=1 Tax=Orchesella dallaii TaxID=48710 RepID=A0ABP1R1N6_9HEXA
MEDIAASNSLRAVPLSKFRIPPNRFKAAWNLVVREQLKLLVGHQIRDIQCYACSQYGHYARHCPVPPLPYDDSDESQDGGFMYNGQLDEPEDWEPQQPLPLADLPVFEEENLESSSDEGLGTEPDDLF